MLTQISNKLSGPLMTRRAFMLTLAASFTALSDGLLSWLMRACRFDAGPRLAAAG